MGAARATESVEMSRHTFAAGGNRVGYRRTGQADEVVVLLHGFPQTGRSWEKVALQLADRFTVVAPDLRGAGGSQRPANGYDKKTMAADIHDLVASFGSRPIHLVGHDIGGMVAYAYAAQWPAEVASLAMVDMLLPGFGVEALYAIRQPGQFAHMSFFMAQDLPEWLVSGREEAFLDWFVRGALVDQAAISADDMTAYARAYAQPGGLRAAFDWFRGFWRDAEDNKGFAQTKLPMPVLAVGGARSVGDRLEKSLRPLADDVRGFIVEDCGHFVPDEQPNVLARELSTLFAEGSA